MITKIRFFLSAVAIASFASCDSPTSEKVEEKIDTMAARVENKVDNALDRDENKEFVNDAVENNNKELYLLALGRKMGTSSELRNAAKEMEADHKKMGEEVLAFAKTKGIALDDVDTTDTNHDMATRDKGAEWDKDWVDKMVNDHEKDVKLFEDAVDDVEDAELKTWINNTLPTLRHHLEMAKKMQDKMKK
jgi:putative membrane protein